MDNKTANNWKSQVLDIIFEALSENESLVRCIVFKGARVLNKRLDSYSRQSLDIDANLLAEFVNEHKDLLEVRDVLKREIEKAINNYFDKQSPVVYELDRVKIDAKPPKGHELGWNAFEVTVSINDLARAGVRGLPNLKIDIAAPEELGDESISSLAIGNGVIKAYTLERIAGEKLRAFLSSLPSYRRKVNKPGHAVRAKDIYDIARIVTQYPINEVEFWRKVGEEFKRACQSRYIDCSGMVTFEEGMSVTRETYNSDSTLPNDIGFDDAWDVATKIINLFEKNGLLPFEFSLPEG